MPDESAKLTQDAVRDGLLTTSREQLVASFSQEARQNQAVVHETIGGFIATWATAESAYISLIEAILHIEPAQAFAIWSAFTSSNPKFELLSKLAAISLSEDVRKKVDKLVEKFKAPTALRNEVVHSEYVLNKDFTYAYMSAYDRKASGEAYPEKATLIDQQFINKLSATIAILSELAQQALLLSVEIKQAGKA